MLYFKHSILLIMLLCPACSCLLRSIRAVCLGLTVLSRVARLRYSPHSLACTMAEAASPQPVEHSSMELMDSAIDDTGADAAASAAAAVLAALPAEPVAAAGR